MKHADTEIITQELSLEDHLWLFWHNQKKMIFSCILAIIIGLGSVQGYHAIKKAKLENMQTAYLNALSHDELEAFTLTYPNDPLSGMACLQIAKKAEKDNNLPKAIDFYEKSFPKLTHHPLLGRAKINHAIALALSNENAAAIDALTRILNDNTAPLDFISEAAYHKALILISINKNDEALETLNLLMTQPHSGIWQHKGEMLRMVLPQTNLPK